MLPAIRAGSPNRLSDVFDALFDAPIPAPAQAWGASPMAAWEDENAITVEVDAPGVSEADVEVSFHQNELVVRGERKPRRPGGYDARAYGRFERRVSLPPGVDAARVTATLADGVLTVTCPKGEAAKPRRIAVQTSRQIETAEQPAA